MLCEDMWMVLKDDVGMRGGEKKEMEDVVCGRRTSAQRTPVLGELEVQHANKEPNKTTREHRVASRTCVTVLGSQRPRESRRPLARRDSILTCRSPGTTEQ